MDRWIPVLNVQAPYAVEGNTAPEMNFNTPNYMNQGTYQLGSFKTHSNSIQMQLGGPGGI